MSDRWEEVRTYILTSIDEVKFKLDKIYEELKEVNSQLARHDERIKKTEEYTIKKNAGISTGISALVVAVAELLKHFLHIR